MAVQVLFIPPTLSPLCLPKVKYKFYSKYKYSTLQEHIYLLLELSKLQHKSRQTEATLQTFHAQHHGWNVRNFYHNLLSNAVLFYQSYKSFTFRLYLLA